VSSLKARRLILVRHGETAWNAEGRIQGMLDVPLNALGLEQSKRVAEELARTVDSAEMVSSDLVRTRETAKPITLATGFNPRFDARIRERHFGVWQGMTYEEWRIKDAEGMARYNAGEADYGPQGGETAREFLERCVNAVSDLVIACNEKTLILVTHGGVVSSMVRHSQGLGFHSARTWSVPNASISEWRVQFQDGAPVFYCDRVGDATHLEAAALDEVDK
jgi:probable phosphoglycerate mutase